MGDIRMVMLGRLSDRSRQEWSRRVPDLDVIELAHAAPSGLRLGRRALGIGADSMAVALKARLARPAHATVAMSPWPGVACRMFGIKNLAIVGLYAQPHSKPWDFLVRKLGDTPLVVTSEREASDWVAAGGRARPVVWGGTFGSALSKPKSGSVPRVFVGGTSDRDGRALGRFVESVMGDRVAVELVIANGSGPRQWVGRRSRVEWLPYIPQSQFIAALSRSHAVYLPVRETGRSAGQMVLVASMEAGLPTLIHPNESLQPYHGEGIECVDAVGHPLDRLIRMADTTEDVRRSIRKRWERDFSLRAFSSNVLDALGQMDWPGSIR
ncbi:hypothetical protein ACU639_19395 [Streptomyces cynarae]|uniref:hypothetical protein n=1 Tax=Streptomyces cynarae TaxID=2981134 RepID=UPI00406C7D3C